jgi:hypothetical protein
MKSATIKTTSDNEGGWVCCVNGLTLRAPQAGGLETDDGRVLLPASDYHAITAAHARWLVRYWLTNEEA